MKKSVLILLFPFLIISCSRSYISSSEVFVGYENEVREAEEYLLNAYKEKSSQKYLKYIADYASFWSIEKTCDKKMAKKYWSNSENFVDSISWEVSSVRVMEVHGLLVATVAYFEEDSKSAAVRGPYKSSWVKVNRKLWQLVDDGGNRICAN